MTAQHHPIEPHEVPYLQALGAEVRRLRLAAEVGKAELARLTGVSESQVRNIEDGIRRTRRSTLEKIAGWLIPVEEWATPDSPSEEQEAGVVERLVMAAGPALAPEKLTLEQRIERRARELAASWVGEYRRTGIWPEHAIEANDVA